MTLEEISTHLEALYTSPCFCNPCKSAKAVLKNALAEQSPLGDELMAMIAAGKMETPEFQELERRYRADELKRLTDANTYIKRYQCEMTRTPVQGPPKPDLPPPQLPAGHRYGSLLRQRRGSIEYLKSPKIPGSYLIK